MLVFCDNTQYGAALVTGTLKLDLAKIGHYLTPLIARWSVTTQPIVAYLTTRRCFYGAFFFHFNILSSRFLHLMLACEKVPWVFVVGRRSQGQRHATLFDVVASRKNHGSLLIPDRWELAKPLDSIFESKVTLHRTGMFIFGSQNIWAWLDRFQATMIDQNLLVLFGFFTLSVSRDSAEFWASLWHLLNDNDRRALVISLLLPGWNVWHFMLVETCVQ